ncbi:putative phosphoketolase [Bienertia sinuspersici]
MLKRFFFIHGQSFHFHAYPNWWLSLYLAKRNIGMVLISEYSDNKKKKGKNNKIEIVINSIEFQLIDRKPKIKLFQLHQLIFQMGQDSRVYGRFSTEYNSALIAMDSYQDRVLDKRT